MKRIVFILFLLIVLQWNSPQLYSQYLDKTTLKNNITFNVTRLFLMEARFGYERHITDKHIVRTSAGLQFPITSESFPSLIFDLPFYYVVSNGFYLSLGYNYVIKLYTGLYVSGEIYFNYSYYNEKYYKHCTGSDNDTYVKLQSMRLKASGIKFLIGEKMSMSSKKETRLQFDFFVGLGIQYRQEEITVFKKKLDECSVEGQHEYQVYDPPEKAISNRWYPTLHAGILFSFPF